MTLDIYGHPFRAQDDGRDLTQAQLRLIGEAVTTTMVQQSRARRRYTIAISIA
jgi:hypothetical protein